MDQLKGKDLHLLPCTQIPLKYMYIQNGLKSFLKDNSYLLPCTQIPLKYMYIQNGLKSFMKDNSCAQNSHIYSEKRKKVDFINTGIFHQIVKISYKK